MGSCVGQSAGETKVEFIEVPRTEIVHEPAPAPEEVLVVPQACVKAIEYAFRIAEAAENNYQLSTRQLNIISDGRRALASGDNTSEVEVAQRQLQGDAVGNLYDLEVALERFDIVGPECKKEVE